MNGRRPAPHDLTTNAMHVCRVYSKVQVGWITNTVEDCRVAKDRSFGDARAVGWDLPGRRWCEGLVLSVLWGGRSSFQQVGSGLYLSAVVRVFCVLGVARGLGAGGTANVNVGSGCVLRQIEVRGSVCVRRAII